MIVRVQGSGQYRLADGALSELNMLDSDLQKAVDGFLGNSRVPKFPVVKQRP